MAQDSNVNNAYTEKLEQWKTEFDTMFTTFIEQLKPAERLRSEDPSTIPIENLGDEIDKIEADIDVYTSTHKTLQFTNIIEHISDVFTRLEKIDVEHSETRQAAKREKIERLNRVRKALEGKIHSLPIVNCPDCDK